MTTYRTCIALLAAVLSPLAPSPAQDQVRTWGLWANDSEMFQTSLRKISVCKGNLGWTLGLTREGRILGFGGGSPPPEPPPGLRYVDAFAAEVPFGLLSDGTLVQFLPFDTGLTPPTSAPVLPPGMRWLDLASTYHRAFAIRSDRTLHAWGTHYAGIELVPTLPPGRSFVSLASSPYWMAALVSDGTVVTWGNLATVVQPVPPLPPGVTYIALEAGRNHLFALRSDGRAVAWGDNSLGQLNVPSLPAGMTYVAISAGGDHNVALRSDGQWLAWGYNHAGQINIPPHPPGTFSRMVAGSAHTVGVRPDGKIVSWGEFEWLAARPAGSRFEDLDVCWASVLTLTRSAPASPLALSMEFPRTSWNQFWATPLDPGPGRALTSVKACSGMLVGLVDDGSLRVWSGDNSWGQLNVPALPPGLTYTAVDVGVQNAVAIRSDGSAVGWGDNTWGQATMPALPPGLRYTAVGAGEQNVLLLRSDGSMVMAGTGGTTGLTSLPSLPAGLRYTAVACGKNLAAALRSDGTVVSWGGTVPVPALPPGVSYVEVACGNRHAVARRSDGAAVTWGITNQPARITAAPILPRGRSYLRVAAGDTDGNAALIGSESRYVGFAAGCPGSLAPSRIVPGDTPQIGKTFPALLTNLPTNLALLGFGWQRQLPPTPLAAVGMPGCSAHIVADAIVPIGGTAHEAEFTLPIPFLPGLLGLKFYNQAIVLDPAANNPAGAVVGEAMEGVIGG